MGYPATFCETAFTVQKVNFSIKDFFSKCEKIRSFPLFFIFSPNDNP